MANNDITDIIGTVEYVYIGTDDQFKDFLKSIITDYLSEDRLQPEEKKSKKTA